MDYNIKYWLTKKLILRGLHAVCKKINISTILGKGYFEHFANSKLKIKLHMCILLSVLHVPASSLWTRTSLFRKSVMLTFLCKATDWSVSLLFSHRNSSILVRPTRVCLSMIETKSMKVISVHYWHYSFKLVTWVALRRNLSWGIFELDTGPSCSYATRSALVFVKESACRVGKSMLMYHNVIARLWLFADWSGNLQGRYEWRWTFQWCTCYCLWKRCLKWY